MTKRKCIKPQKSPAGRTHLHTLPPSHRVQKIITLTAGALRRLRDMGYKHGHSATREAEIAINKHVGID